MHRPYSHLVMHNLAAPGKGDTPLWCVFLILYIIEDQSSGECLCVCVTERANFPTDLYMLEGLVRQLGDRHELRLVAHDDDISTSITDDVAVVVLTHVSYRTGRMLNMAQYTQLAHRA